MLDEFQSVIHTVERNINDMFLYQSHSRNAEARDMALLEDNNSYVQTWSLAQIVIIVITCSVQVISHFQNRHQNYLSFQLRMYFFHPKGVFRAKIIRHQRNRLRTNENLNIFFC